MVRDFKRYTAKTILKQIQKLPENRCEWMLERFAKAGKKDVKDPSIIDDIPESATIEFLEKDRVIRDKNSIFVLVLPRW